MNRVTYWNDEYGCWSYHCSIEDAAKLLAAYEATGLEPREISEAADRRHDCKIDCLLIAYNALLEEIEGLGGFEHLRYLSQAEKDGRLVVLPPNTPLTLEDLREMDGEPVFVREIKNSDRHRWAFVDAGCEVVRYFTTRNGVACHVIGNYFKTYGKTWLAYRRKPEASSSKADPDWCNHIRTRFEKVN